MNIPGHSPRKSHLFAVGIFLILLGGVFVFLGSHNFEVRLLGMLAVIASVFCFRASGNRARSVSETIGKIGWSTWITNGMLLPLLALSFYFLYRDASQGYHTAWPVYFFAGTSLACTLSWSYLVSRLL